MIYKLAIIFLAVICLAGCKGKKTNLAATDVDTFEDFADLFPDVQLPFQMTDSMLNKKESPDSSINNVFARFIPDSIITVQFGKVKPEIYALGKATLKKAETYLFLKAATPTKKLGMIVALDKNQKFLASLPLLSTGRNPLPYRKAGMDKKYTLIQTFEQKAEDGSLYEGRNVYILNTEAHEFSKILTDEGATTEVQDIINPIDTFAHTGNFTGDYIKDKRNFISIRDGRDPSMVLFFVHFEKNGGDCTGELKGEAAISGTKKALFRATGNPCILEFNFSGNTVSIKEDEACGSYRDIKCFFEGSYSKKAAAQPKKKKART